MSNARAENLKSGVYHNLPAQDYFDLPAVNASYIKARYSTTALHVAEGEGGGPALQTAILGNVFHQKCLEPHRAADTVLWHREDRRGGYREKAEELLKEGKNLILPSEDNDTNAMVESAMAHPKIGELLRDGRGRKEMTLLWDDKCGLKGKARVDLSIPERDLIVDLKSCRDASPQEFPTQFFALKYYVQAAYYQRGARALGIPAKYFAFACVEKSKPFAANLFLVTEPVMDWANEIIERVLSDIQADALLETPTTGWPPMTRIEMPSYFNTQLQEIK